MKRTPVPLGALPELFPGESILVHVNAWPQRRSCRPGTLYLTNYRIFWSDGLPSSHFAGPDCSFVPEEPPPPLSAPSASSPSSSSSASWSSEGRQQPGPVSLPFSAIDSAKWSASGSRREIRIVSKHFLVVRLVFLPDDGASERVETVLEHFAFGGSPDVCCFAFPFARRAPFDRAEGGWSLFSPRAEFSRIGLPDTSWRITELNARFTVCDSYPAVLAVPAAFTDDQIREAAAFRTSGRFPVLCWRHPSTMAAIVRSSQPKVGILDKQSEADVALIGQIRAAASRSSGLPQLSIIDARPRMNAVVNRATKGAGSENVSRYSRTNLHFMNIENIHVMRESKRRLRKLVFRSRIGKANLSPSEIEATGWLSHIQQLLAASVRVAVLVSSGVSTLVHCSDGWDRTPQITSIAQLLLDPFYRTLRGFAILVEKEWLGFGHKFIERLGIGRPEDSECSPIFLQFLDVVWQISLQFPCSFEFNEQFLIDVADEMHFARTGTFLANTEKDRVEQKLPERTVSLWTVIFASKQKYTNSLFTPEAGLINPKTEMRYVRLWKNYYARWLNVTVDQLGWGMKFDISAIHNQAVEAIQRRPSASQARVFKAIVLCDYEAKEEGQLSLKVGTEVFVITESNHQFWFVSADFARTRIGYFPKAFLKRLPGQTVRPIPEPSPSKSPPPSSWVMGSRKGQNSRGKKLAEKHHRHQESASAPPLKGKRSYLGSLLAKLEGSKKVLQTMTHQEIDAAPATSETSSGSPLQARTDPEATGTPPVRRRSMSSAMMPSECVALLARETLASKLSKAIDDTIAAKRKTVVQTWGEAKIIWAKKPLHPRLRTKRVKPARPQWPIVTWKRRTVSHAAFRRQTDPGGFSTRAPFAQQYLARKAARAAAGKSVAVSAKPKALPPHLAGGSAISKSSSCDDVAQAESKTVTLATKAASMSDLESVLHSVPAAILSPSQAKLVPPADVQQSSPPPSPPQQQQQQSPAPPASMAQSQPLSSPSPAKPLPRPRVPVLSPSRGAPPPPPAHAATALSPPRPAPEQTLKPSTTPSPPPPLRLQSASLSPAPVTGHVSALAKRFAQMPAKQVPSTPPPRPPGHVKAKSSLGLIATTVTPSGARVVLSPRGHAIPAGQPPPPPVKSPPPPAGTV